jgi:hypothetical protein
LTYLADHQAYALGGARFDPTRRGKGWRTRFEAGLHAMQAQLPDMVAAVARCRQLAADCADMQAPASADGDA